MNVIPNTPILEFFRCLELPVPNHFNQSVMLAASKRINVYTLKASLGILCQYHDMLRAVWNGMQLVVRDITADGLFHLEEHNLRNSSDLEADILPLCESLQSSIDIAKGPLMRVAVFHLKEKDVVLFVIHHLVVDGVSWRIILEDTNKIYTTLLQGRLSVGMPKRTCSFAQYAEALNEYAGSVELLQEEAYWQDVADKIKCCEHNFGQQTGETSFAAFQLDEENSSMLVGTTCAKTGADINALLLTAISRAWKKVTGQGVLSISMEGHGREQFGKSPLALERLVGWFTTIYPIALTYSDSNPLKHISGVQSMLQSIPNKGFGYGVLSNISLKENLRCVPLMTFNYLGAFEEANAENVFTIDTTMRHGKSVSPENRPDTALSINCAMNRGKLSGELTYDMGMFDDTCARNLCAEFVLQLKTFNEL